MYRNNPFMDETAALLAMSPFSNQYQTSPEDLIAGGYGRQGNLDQIIYMLAANPVQDRLNQINQLTDDVAPMRTNTPMPQQAPGGQGYTSQQAMDAADRMIRQMQSQQQAQQPKRPVYDVVPVNVVQRDKQGNVIGETLMYYDRKTKKYYPEDPNFQ